MDALELTALNFVTRVCRSLQESLNFYISLGFNPIGMPGPDDDGAWLFAFGQGMRLIPSENAENLPLTSTIEPNDKRISFQSANIEAVENKLREMGIDYTRDWVESGGMLVDHLFFHDPDGLMIEVCSLESLPAMYSASWRCHSIMVMDRLQAAQVEQEEMVFEDYITGA